MFCHFFSLFPLRSHSFKFTNGRYLSSTGMFHLLFSSFIVILLLYLFIFLPFLFTFFPNLHSVIYRQQLPYHVAQFQIYQWKISQFNKYISIPLVLSRFLFYWDFTLIFVFVLPFLFTFFFFHVIYRQLLPYQVAQFQIYQ